jgi:ERCC4-type nuclease
MNTSLPLSIGRPATNALEAIGISCLEDLCKISEKELAELHGVGPKAIRILKDSLDTSNMCLLTDRVISS